MIEYLPRINGALLAALLATAALPTTASAVAPDVVVSIKPLHSLVASVMKGVAEPVLIIKGSSSPHTYNMKPSDAAAVADAAIVFWGGESLEHFLVKPLQTLAAGAKSIALLDAPGVKQLSPREGGTFDPDRDGDEVHAHGEEVDPHFWLDPENARAAVKEIAATLEKADPENAATYAANATATDAELAAMEERIAAELKPVEGKPFIVFHDAYQYFEKRFGLAAAGSVTVAPEVQPGAARIAEIEQKVRSLGAVCIYSEPQFEPKLVETISAATGARKGVLDPVGSDLEAGPGLYQTLITNLANSLKGCLSGE